VSCHAILCLKLRNTNRIAVKQNVRTLLSAEENWRSFSRVCEGHEMYLTFKNEADISHYFGHFAWSHKSDVCLIFQIFILDKCRCLEQVAAINCYV
jgi:hypothetical protein